MFRPIPVVVAVTVALSTAACTGSDDEAGTTVQTPVSTILLTTTSTTTPSATTSTTTSTTSTTTTAPTTTIAPTTTTDPIAVIEAAVKQARLDGEAAINDAGANPTDPTLRARVAMFNTGERLRRTTDYLDELAADGLAFRQLPDNPSRIEFRGPVELPEGRDSTEAFLRECRVDTDVVFVRAEPGAPEIVVDDAVVTRVGTVRYVLEDGQWKNDSGVVENELVGVDKCP